MRGEDAHVVVDDLALAELVDQAVGERVRRVLGTPVERVGKPLDAVRDLLAATFDEAVGVEQQVAPGPKGTVPSDHGGGAACSTSSGTERPSHTAAAGAPSTAITGGGWPAHA